MSYTDNFTYGVSAGIEVVGRQGTATITADLTSAAHPVVNLSLDVTMTPAEVAAASATILGAMQHTGMDRVMATSVTYNGGFATCTAGTQDASYTLAGLTVAQISADFVALHADYPMAA